MVFNFKFLEEVSNFSLQVDDFNTTFPMYSTMIVMIQWLYTAFKVLNESILLTYDCKGNLNLKVYVVYKHTKYNFHKKPLKKYGLSYRKKKNTKIQKKIIQNRANFIRNGLRVSYCH